MSFQLFRIIMLVLLMPTLFVLVYYFFKGFANWLQRELEEQGYL